MNPFRMFILSLSRIPPAAMLALIVGVAAVVAFAVNYEMTRTAKIQQEANDQLRSELQKKGKAVFAIKDIPEGTTIPSDAVEEREILISTIPTDAISSASLAAGRVAKYGIVANAILSQHDLAAQSVVQGFESRLPEGYRAITFGVDNNTGVAGFIIPDTHIDILATTGSGAETKAEPVLSDVKVIAVGQTFQRTPGTSNTSASSVTVAVSPEDAKKLVKAIVASKLYVTLRNDQDHTPVATVDVSNLFRKPATAAQVSMLPDYKSELPPPPSFEGAGQTAPKGLDLQSPAIAPNLRREVEMWSGSRKDILSVPNS